MDKSKQTFTIEEAAELLSCHAETVRREIRNGRLKAAKVGRDYRISRLQLSEYWRGAGGGELFDKKEMVQSEILVGQNDFRMTRSLKSGADISGGMERAEKIALMLRLRKEGLEFQGIADEMMRRGIKTTRGNDKWHKGSVHAMLKKYFKEEL